MHLLLTRAAPLSGACDRPVLHLFSTACCFQLQVHLAIEAALVVMLVVGLLQRSYRPGAPVAERLTEKVRVSRVYRSHSLHHYRFCLSQESCTAPARLSPSDSRRRWAYLRLWGLYLPRHSAQSLCCSSQA